MSTNLSNICVCYVAGYSDQFNAVRVKRMYKSTVGVKTLSIDYEQFLVFLHILCLKQTAFYTANSKQNTRQHNNHIDISY